MGMKIFSFSNDKSVSSTNGFTLKKQQGSEPGPEHKWKTYCLDTGCACGQNEGRVCHKKSHYSNLEIVFEKNVYLVTLVLVL